MKLSGAALLSCLALAMPQACLAQTQAGDPLVIVPLRVHILTAPEIAEANCQLSDQDIVRVIGHVNAIWHKGGLHFGLESIAREPAEQQERFKLVSELNGGELDVSALPMLMPRSSRGFDGLHAYLFHDLPFHSAYLGDDIVIAQEGAELNQVAGGGDDPVARVTAHALGNALGLQNDPEPRNLMGNGTSGVALDESQVEAARKMARTVRGVASVAAVRKAAEAAEAGGDARAARRLWSWLAEVPGPGAAEAQRHRDALEAPRP